MTCLKYPLITIFLGSVWWAGLLQAKEIYFQPSINIQTEYDDNKRLRGDNLDALDTSAYGVITRATARVGVLSNRYNLALNNLFVINRYSSDFDLDSEDFYGTLTASYNATERSTFRLSGNYTRDTTLTSELDDNGTGLVQDNPIRQQWSITPDWTYFLSNTQFLQVSYSHSETSYEESEVGEFVDYTTDIVSLSYSQQWTALLRNFISVSAMSFDVPKIGSGIFESSRETTEYSINVGMDYQFLPTWSASLTAGQRFTNTETTQKFNFNTLTFEEVTTSDDVQGLIFSFSVDKQLEAGIAGISYSRSTSAQGNGELQVRDKFAANYSYNYSQSLKFSLNSGITATSSSGSEDDGDDRTFYNIKPSIRWLFDRHTSITAAYQYRMQEFESSNEAATSNAFFLSFNYQWDKLATQRY